MILSTITSSLLVAACYVTSTTWIGCPSPPAELPQLLDATLGELRTGLDSGSFTSVDLVKAYIARIDEVNSRLHAVNEGNPDAIAIAAEKDRERQSGSVLPSPLHGIPVLLKDNIATNDGLNNSAGSYALLGARPKSDSTVAAKLRKSGAIILGKANLSQWAGMRGANVSEGWSAYGGQTTGAYFPDQRVIFRKCGFNVCWAGMGFPGHRNYRVHRRPGASK